MDVADYPRPDRDNGRGLHWSASIYHPIELDDWMARLRAMNMRWLKVLDDGGGSSLRLCGRLLDEGIMPVVRLYRPTPNPGHIGGSEEKTIRDLVKLGVRYIETNNEPDLQTEWSISRPLDWLGIVAENWLFDAGKCLDRGALPAVPALSVGRKDDLFQAIISKGGKDALSAGAWVAIHNYNLNHPLDYPDDDINQRGLAVMPAEYDAEGTWAWDSVPLDTINTWRWQDKNPGDTILDDPACFRSFEFANHLAVKALGFSLPIITTEGGVVMGWRDDRRYPRISPRLHREMTLAMFSYMQTSAPAYYFAMCPWLIANFHLGHWGPGWESQAWFTDWWNDQFGLSGRIPTVDAVMAMPSVSRLEVQGPHHSVIRGNVEAMRGVSALKATVRSEGFSAAANTDAAGGFSFAGLAPGTYSLQVGGLIKAGLQLDGTNTLTFAGLRPPVPATPALDWDRRLSDLRVTMTAAEAAAGAPMWRLVQARFLDRAQAGVGGAVYFDVLDELGRPLAGQEVILSWPGDTARKATEQVEPPAHGAEFSISASYDPSVEPGPFGAWVDGLPSDRVTGIGMPAGQKVAFVLTFQRGPATGAQGSAIEGAIAGDTGGRAITIHQPNGKTVVVQTESDGTYALADLPPGLYDLEVGGQGIVGRGLMLDGTNTLVFDYALPAQASTIHGRVVGGQAGIDVWLHSDEGEERRTTLSQQGTYEFRLLPAGTYTIRIAGQTVSGLRADGVKTLEAPVIDIRQRQGVVAGVVRSARGTPLDKATVTLVGPDGPDSSTSKATTGNDGAFLFSRLLGGKYTVSTGEVSQTLVVVGSEPARVTLVVPIPANEKILQLVLLLGSVEAAGTLTNLRLARAYMRTFTPTLTFRVEEAERAEKVLIVGDLQAVSASDEERLRSAGCEVARIGGTPYSVEDGLARLVAVGTSLPRGRSAASILRRSAAGQSGKI